MSRTNRGRQVKAGMTLRRGEKISRYDSNYVSINGKVRSKAEVMQNVANRGRQQLTEEDIGVSKHDNKKPVQIVDRNGNPQTLSSYQKNKIYQRARELQNEIYEGMCTKDECWNPTDYNCEKMIRKEFPLKDKIAEYKRCMKAIGADPKDLDTEKLRRK